MFAKSSLFQILGNGMLILNIYSKNCEYTQVIYYFQLFNLIDNAIWVQNKFLL